MKRFALSFIIVMSIATSAMAQSGLGYLRNWVGKYPVSSPGELHRNVYRTQPLQRRLVKLLGWKNYTRLLNDYHVMGPIKIVDDYVIVDRCERGNCDESSSFMAVNVRRGDLHVAFYKLGKLQWFHSKGRARDLPRSVLETEWWQSNAPFVKSMTETTKTPGRKNL